MPLQEGDIIERTPMLAVGGHEFSEVNSVPIGCTYRVKWLRDNFRREKEMHTLIVDTREASGEEKWVGTDKGKSYSLPADVVDEPFFKKVNAKL